LHLRQGIVGDEQPTALGMRELRTRRFPARAWINGHAYSTKQRCRHQSIDKLGMIAHHYRKRRTACEAAMVQSDRQFLGPGGKRPVGDDFVGAPHLDKSEDNSVWKAFSLALDELA
jgi:hypothetical protein